MVFEGGWSAVLGIGGVKEGADRVFGVGLIVRGSGNVV
jgi:hypothetical protein